VNSPSKLAYCLLDRLGAHGKPDLAYIAGRIGLRIEEVDSEGFEGSLVRALDGPKGIIAVKKTIREVTRKRFTIAHEIGHYIIPSHRMLVNVCTNGMVETWRDSVKGPELEANEFAVELLLPAHQVRGLLRLNDPSLETIANVANLFETSLTAAALRFIELTDLPCAVVWIENNRAQWYRRSKTLPLYLPKEILPCEGSFAIRIADGREAQKDFAQVEAEAWLDQRDATRVNRVLEHSIRLPRYNAVLSFLWFELKDEFDHDEPPALDDLDPEEFTVRRKNWRR
jgi:IrrE N-terminal-like domain